MPQVWLNKCEWYPIYEPSPGSYANAVQRDVPQDLLDRWTACLAEITRLQHDLSVLYTESVPLPPESHAPEG